VSTCTPESRSPDGQTNVLPPSIPPALMSIKDAAIYIGMSGPYVRRAVTSGSLPVYNLGSQARPYYRIKIADLEKWVEDRKHGPKPVGRKKPPSGGVDIRRSRHW
jgi:excisionase family DNA binding protein